MVLSGHDHPLIESAPVHGLVATLGGQNVRLGLAGDRCWPQCDRMGCPKIDCAAEEVSEGLPRARKLLPRLGFRPSCALEDRVPK